VLGGLLVVGSAQAADTQPTVPPGQSATTGATARLAEADTLIEDGRKLRRAGKSEEAERLLKRALEIRRTVLGIEDPAVGGAPQELGSVYYNRGQFAEAEVLYRQALAIGEKALGPRNLDVADYLGDLGAALREAGRYGEAEQTVQRSISIRALLLSPEHPAVGASLNNLGRLYLKQGLYREAIRALTESVRIYRKAYGAENERVRDGLALLAAAKRGEEAPPPAEVVTNQEGRTPFRLNSGTSVAILNMGPLLSPEGWAGLVLVYETALPLEDEAALRREVDEVWQHFIIDVARSRYDKALIVARTSAAARGTRQSTQFGFAARAEGWIAVERDERAKSGLDAAFVKEFLARFDWLVSNRNGLAASLYLAPDWTATGSANKQAFSLNRDQFVAAVQQMPPGFKHEREIVRTTVAPDGKSALVESRETEIHEQNGTRLKVVGDSVDELVLTGDHVQLIRSREDGIVETEERL
jgi:tetratricopeptide (TPR) repeat protein